ncbi:transcriptional regulator, TetR family [Lactobacillus bombicola]|uniref:TetR/AcrR family transcriptional regulator n=1 Tax=Lactobacillus bombicola TaxID=1505723 RepID=A0A1I1TF08_9LACO|nr:MULTISPECIES: helix-turn-helix domain-containing protein [Lactobacillus]MCO6528470.1 TetR/AcrR family transcriptional regulator [Lactobacillus sp.]RHW49476.1 TetR/AcrR family transcriptional regulator [Lactobacillus bombicola]RHW49539.1 TetR/AcrR family transcriptional regulator [Lactobacillus bombicola]RHW53354.1 TetR/AcrR family transcriptional regulator [Lactobacillus bombicola]RMC42559.1 TetR/AcrR family transcriptional regulator [Lactobacillus sp. ESL0233]
MVKKRSLDLDKIITKATELIAQRGLSATTLPNLANELGVRSQSLYHYVSGRKQLLSLVGASRIKVMITVLTDSLIGLSGKEALLKFADIIRNFILNDPALFSILYHLNEYQQDDAITQEIMNVIALADKLHLRSDSTVSLHSLIGAVLGYVFLDVSASFVGETSAQADQGYHELVLQLVQPKNILQN